MKKTTLALLVASILLTGCAQTDKLKGDFQQSIENIKNEAQNVQQKFKETKEKVEKTVEKVEKLVDAVKAFGEDNKNAATAEEQK